MAEVLNFEHNGITVNATESPEAMGGLGDNVIGLVGTAPNAHASIPKNARFVLTASPPRRCWTLPALKPGRSSTLSTRSSKW